MTKDVISRREFIKGALATGVAMGAGAMCPGILYAAYKVDPAVVKANPQWLNNKTVTGKLPKGSLVIENAHIKNATFSDFEAPESVFRNVIFEDCRFYKAGFWESEFEGVTFKGGLMSNKGDPYYESNLTDFSQSTFKNVTMDGLEIEQANVDGISGKGTRLLLINMKMKNVPHTLIAIYNAHVRIKNCNIQGDGHLINVWESGSVYVTDSVFDGTGFQCDADVTYVQNCKLLNGASLGEAKTIVVKDSVMACPVGGNNSDEIFLINNTHIKMDGFTALRGREDTKIYVDGRNKKNAVMNIMGGGAYIKDLEIIDPAMVRIKTVAAPIEPYTIDLNNVTIRGGRIDRVRLKGGRWQDVTIYPPIKANNGQLRNVQTYNVKFPDGDPWTEIDANTKIELLKSPKPFDFPEIKAPTPQELGLVD